MAIRQLTATFVPALSELFLLAEVPGPRTAVFTWRGRLRHVQDLWGTGAVSVATENASLLLTSGGAKNIKEGMGCWSLWFVGSKR